MNKENISNDGALVLGLIELSQREFLNSHRFALFLCGLMLRSRHIYICED